MQMIDMRSLYLGKKSNRESKQYMALKVQGLESDGVTWTDVFHIEESLGGKHLELAVYVVANMLIAGWKQVRVLNSLGVIQEEGRPVK
jgi:hypothetical protein